MNISEKLSTAKFWADVPTGKGSGILLQTFGMDVRSTEPGISKRMCFVLMYSYSAAQKINLLGLQEISTSAKNSYN